MNDTSKSLPPVGQGRPASVRGGPVQSSSPGQPFLLSHGDSPGEFGLRQYLRLFGHHLRLMVLVGLLPLIGVAVFTTLQPKRYRAHTVLLRVEGGDMPGVQSQGAGLMSVQSALREIANGKMADDVIATLTKAGLAAPTREQLAEMVQASGDEKNQELAIAVVDTNFSRVAAIAKAYGEAVRNRTRAELEGRRKKAEKALEEKSARLAEIYRELSRVGGGVADEAGAQISRLETRMQEAEIQKRELDLRIEKLEQLAKGLAPAAVRQPGADVADLEKALVRAELALAQAETKYYEAHPTYAKLKSERDELLKIVLRKAREQRGDEGKPDIESVQRNLTLLRAERAGVEARIAALDQFIKEKRTTLGKPPPPEQKTAEEMNELLRSQKLLEAAVLGLQKYLEGMNLTSDWTVLTKAVAPGKGDYFSPRWSLNLALGLALALALAVLAAFIAENLEDRIRDQGDLLQRFGLPFLGPVPLRGDDEPLLIDLSQPKSMIASIFEVLRNNINYALPPGAPKVVLMASGVVGEGKSTIAANLAISYCLEGNNALLIDTDLRRPRAHRLFENLCPQAMQSPGLGGYLSGRASLEDVELRTKVPNLSFISAGKGAVNPSKLLGSEEMRRLMEHAKRHYDVIILDGPAVLPVVDSTVVSQFVSGVVLVVSCKHAPAEQVSTAVARLEHVRARIVGMILNRVSGRSRSYGYYGYYGSRYGYGYGYGYQSHYHEETK